MNRGIVQRGVAVANAEKTGCLFEGIGGHLWDTTQLFAVGEGAVLLPMCHNRGGNCSVQAGDVPEKLARCSIDVHPHVVDAALHSLLQLPAQQLLIDIVLVLSHPY